MSSRAAVVGRGPAPARAVPSRSGQHTFAEMAAADAAMWLALDASLDTALTRAFNDEVSAVACAVAPFTAAEICAGVGDDVAGCEAANLVTAATAVLRLSISLRRAAAAAGIAALAADTFVEPERVTVTPVATREQLRLVIGYAAARTALSPLRAVAVPEDDDERSASRLTLDLSTRARAASVLSAAVKAGSVVPGDVVGGVPAVVVVDDGVVEGDIEGDVVVGDPVPSPALHPARRQTASATVPGVLRCIAETPRRFVGVGPGLIFASRSRPVREVHRSRAPMVAQSGTTVANLGICCEFWDFCSVQHLANYRFRRGCTPHRPPRSVPAERGRMKSRRAVGHFLSPVRATVLRRTGMAPSYLVVGTKRGGSTSIAHRISQHPEVAPCRSNKGTHYFDVNYGRGWAWYLSCFPAASSQHRTTGEASPYYMFHPLAPERIAQALPDVRLVVSLREPVARAWSHHQYETQQGFEDQPFAEAIALEESRLAGEEERLRREPTYESFAHRHHAYLRRGQYAEQLERLYQHFDPEQVLVLRSESMFSDPHGELGRVWAHLGLSPVTLDGLDRLKATHRPLDIDGSLARALEDHYRPWNDRLAQLPGVGFTWCDNTTQGDA
jgi:hypothetical protein